MWLKFELNRLQLHFLVFKFFIRFLRWLNTTNIYTYKKPFPLIVTEVPPPVPPLWGLTLDTNGVRLVLYVKVLVTVFPFTATVSEHAVSVAERSFFGNLN